MSLRRSALYLLTAIAAVLLGGRLLAGIYVDLQWHAAQGATSLWREKVAGTLITRGLSGAAAGTFIFLNLLAVRHSVVSLVLPRRVGNIEIGEEIPGRRMDAVAALIALLLGIFLTLPADAWISLANVRHGAPFGERDPYFENDLGFWVYWLPLEQSLFLWALITALVATAVVIFLYALTPSLRWQRGSLYVSNYVRRHLTMLAALLLVLLAWNYRLDGFHLLLSGSGPEGAFSHIDHRARLNANIWLSLITLGAAAVTGWFGWSGQLRPALFTVGGVLLLSLGLRTVLPAAVSRLTVVHDVEARERPYLAIRAGFTRRAFALDRVSQATEGLVFESAARAAEATTVWDPVVLALTVARGRTGDLPPAIGWLATPDALLAVVPQPPADRAQRAEPWIVRYVLAIAADSRGDPILVGADGRPFPREVRSAPMVVYPGAAGHVIVQDQIGRVAGPELESLSSRLGHAWSMQNLGLLFGDPPYPQRIVTHRDVRERVRALVPFFTQGTVISPLVAADTVHWSVDLYTASRTYPLADRVFLGDREYRFAQRAATAIVNGSTGHVFIVADPGFDPLTRGMMDAFPELFTSWDRIPEALIRAIPPAVDEARAQAVVLARYGMRGDAVRRGRPAGGERTDTLIDRGAPPIFMLPGGTGLGWSYGVLDPRDRLAGLVVGSGGASRASHWIPLEGEGPRWSTMLDLLQRAIDTIPDFPAESRALRGRLRLLPTPDDPLIVQPTFAWRTDQPPVLARVATVARRRVRLGTSLAMALGVPAPVIAEEAEPLTGEEFRARVNALYDAMRSAMERGDWTAFGRSYEALGTLLQRPPR